SPPGDGRPRGRPPPGRGRHSRGGSPEAVRARTPSSRTRPRTEKPIRPPDGRGDIPPSAGEAVLPPPPVPPRAGSPPPRAGRNPAVGGRGGGRAGRDPAVGGRGCGPPTTPRPAESRISPSSCREGSCCRRERGRAGREGSRCRREGTRSSHLPFSPRAGFLPPRAGRNPAVGGRGEGGPGGILLSAGGDAVLPPPLSPRAGSLPSCAGRDPAVGGYGWAGWLLSRQGARRPSGSGRRWTTWRRRVGRVIAT